MITESKSNNCTQTSEWWNRDDTNTYSGENYSESIEQPDALEKRAANHDALWAYLDRLYPYCKTPTLQKIYCVRVVTRTIKGAYSRKFDRVRKFRKKRLL